MKQLGLFTGGFSEERVVALKSAAWLRSHIVPQNFGLHVIDVQKNGWTDEQGNAFDLNTGALMIDGQAVKIDAALVIIHGSPAEDGLIQGYFDMMDIPYSCCSAFVSALTFDKQATKNHLRPYQVPMAKSLLIRQGDSLNKDEVYALGLPLFVKPNKHGSSFGITKVKHWDDFANALNFAFEFDKEVVVESFINGREFSSGVIEMNGEVIALPLTEIKSHNEFFDYAAKYEQQSDEITPAELPESLSEQCRALSERIYRILNCKGMVRFDYILEEDTFYFLEANTIPGLSPTSILPQQLEAQGIEAADFVRALIESTLTP
jgi:D-alanine-D-alanine ligase